jgi:hypothetical protein
MWTDGAEGEVLGTAGPDGGVEVWGLPAGGAVDAAPEPAWRAWLGRVLERVAAADPPDVREADAVCPSGPVVLCDRAAPSARLTAVGRALMVAGPRWVGAVWPVSSNPTAAPPPAITTAATVATVVGTALTDAPGWANCAALRADRSRPEARGPLPE